MNKHRFFFQSHSFELAIKLSDSKNDLDIKPTEKLNLERLKSVFTKDAFQKSEGVSEVRFRKTRLLHLGNVEKPPHPQFFAQRAPKG